MLRRLYYGGKKRFSIFILLREGWNHREGHQDGKVIEKGSFLRWKIALLCFFSLRPTGEVL